MDYYKPTGLEEWINRGIEQAQKRNQTAAPAPVTPQPTVIDTGSVKRTTGTDYSRELSEQNALPWQRYLGTDISRDLPQQMINQGATPDYYLNTTNRNVNDKLSLPTVDPLGSKSPMMSAINKRYEKRFDDSMKSFRANQGYDASKYQADQLTDANKIMAAVEQNKMQNFKEQWDFQMQRYERYNAWKRAESEARSNVICQVLGMFVPFGVPA